MSYIRLYLGLVNNYRERFGSNAQACQISFPGLMILGAGELKNRALPWMAALDGAAYKILDVCSTVHVSK